MKNSFLIILLSTVLFSCTNNSSSGGKAINGLNPDEIESAFKGNTYTTTIENMATSHTLDFKKSMYKVLETKKDSLPWGVHYVNENIYLNLDGDLLEIFEKNNDTIRGRIMNPKFLVITFVKK